MDQRTCRACGDPIQTSAGRGRPRLFCNQCSRPKCGKDATGTATQSRPGTPTVCEWCGNTFLSPAGRTTCSDRCRQSKRWATVPRQPCAGCGDQTSKPLGQTGARCQHCRPQMFDHGTRKGYRDGKCRCDQCKAWKLADSRLTAQRVKASADTRPRCVDEGCARPMCSRGMCKMHYKRWARAHGMINSPSEDWRTPRRTALLIQRRAIVRGATGPADRFTVHDLIARDGNTCGICGEPIEGTRYPHPMSASIDHIIPISLGGPHTLTNARATHLRCNIRRGNRD